jgi:predicted phosphodiesterase
MRIHVLSDLHLEFAAFDLPDVAADVIVLAGDIHTRDRGLAFANQCARCPIIYVAGNHEYYGAAIPKLDDQLANQTAGTSMRFLQNAAAEIDGVRFFGTTLWTDFCLLGEPTREAAMAVSRTTMTDYKKTRITPDYRQLTPTFVLSQFRQSLAFLKTTLARPFNGPTVVVTHHAPSLESLAPSHRGDVISASYASSLDELICASGATLWIHGHTHRCADYHVGETRIVSNQRGYPGETSLGFEPTRLVTL